MREVFSKCEGLGRSGRDTRAETRTKAKARQEPKSTHMGAGGLKIDIKVNSGAK